MGNKKISEVSDAQEVLKIFQDFYSLTGRLPLSNNLLVVPDGDAPPEEKLNMRHFYDLFKNTNSHGIVSLPFLGLIQYYLEENDHSLIKNTTTELYYNLSYMTLSGGRGFRFDDISELTARLSILLKHATLGNNKLREIGNENLAKKINEERIFEPKIEDPLDEVIEITDVPDMEHKKSMFPCVEPTVETADEIETNQQLIDDDFIDLQTKFDKANDVVTEQKKQKKIEETIESVIDDKNPFSTFDNFWWEDEMFSERDSVPTVDTSKDILEEINEISDNVLRNLRLLDTRAKQETIEDQFIPMDDRTQQELKDDNYLSFKSESEGIEVENIDTTSALDENKSTAAKPGAIFKLSTDYNKKINAQPAAKKISEKYKKLREVNARKQKYKMPVEIVRIEKLETDQGEVKVPVSTEKPKRSGKEADKKIIKNMIRLGDKKHLKRSWTRTKKRKRTKI